MAFCYIMRANRQAPVPELAEVKRPEVGPMP